MEISEKRFPLNLKSAKGARYLLFLLVAAILVSSFAAALVSSNGGNVKISHLKIDARGAELDMDLYVPAGVSDSDSLPCVLIAHGRGAIKNMYRGVAEELARRGFVVLNVNAYGMGLSEQPVSDDGGKGAEEFSFGGSPYGMIDALSFARSLKYVDATRIAMFGHSFGSGRISVAAAMDAGFYTFNDIMINVLADTFGQTFTEDEIAQNADELAAARLSADQLTYYESIRTEKKAIYDTRLSTILLTGSGDGPGSSAVMVGGHEVTRECQVNVTFVNGMYDSLGPGAMWSTDGTAVVFGQPVEMENWYQVSQDGAEYTKIGKLDETTVRNSDALAAALQSRAARIVCYNPESHSKQYFSIATSTDTVRILSQALNYNRGNLTDTTTQPLDGGRTIWWLRAVLNLIAMLCMLGAIFPIIALLTGTQFFSSCVAEKRETKLVNGSKPAYWIMAAVTVVLTVLVLLKANSGGPVWANPFGKHFLPQTLRLVTTSMITFWFVFWLTVTAAILIIAKGIIARKATGELGLREMNLNMKFVNVCKTLLIAVIVIASANAMLTMIEDLFNQDFRFWQMQFTEMKAEHWLVALPYMVIFSVCYFILGLAINHGARTDISERKEMILTIIINSLGVWLLCLFVYVMSRISWAGTPISDFTLSFSMLLFVPVTVYISRKVYKMTNSIWLGAFINAMLLAWTMVCSSGTADQYFGQNILSVIFGV